MLLQEAVAEHPRRGTPGTELTKATSDGDSCDRLGSVPKALSRRSNSFSNLSASLRSSQSPEYLLGIFGLHCVSAKPIPPRQVFALDAKQQDVNRRCFEVPLWMSPLVWVQQGVSRRCVEVRSGMAPLPCAAIKLRWRQKENCTTLKPKCLSDASKGRCAQQGVLNITWQACGYDVC